MRLLKSCEEVFVFEYSIEVLNLLKFSEKLVAIKAVSMECI